MCLFCLAAFYLSLGHIVCVCVQVYGIVSIQIPTTHHLTELSTYNEGEIEVIATILCCRGPGNSDTMMFRFVIIVLIQQIQKWQIISENDLDGDKL